MESLSWMFKLVDGMSGPAGKMAKGLEGLAGKIAKGGSAVKSFGSHVKEFAAKAEPVIETAKEIGEALLGLVEKGIEFGKFVIEAAEFKKHTVAALEILEGNAKTANETFKTLQAMSNNAGVKTEDLVGLYKQLRSAGYAAKEAQDIIAGGLDVKAVFGGESGDAVINSLKTIKELGVFKGKSIKPILKQANIPIEEVKKQLAKMKGMTVEQIGAAMDSGQIKADEGVSAILAVIQQKFDKGKALGTAAKSLIGDTVGGQVEVFENRLHELFEDSTLGEPIKNALKTINTLLSADSVAGKKLREILAAALGAITSLLDSLLSEDNVTGAFDAILGVADFIKQGVEFIWPYLEALGGPLWAGIKDVVEPLIGTFKNLFSGKGAANPKLLTGLRELGRLLGWVIGIVIDLVAWGTAASVVFAGALVGAIGYLIAGFDGVAAAVRDAFNAVVDFFDDVLDAITDMCTSAVEVGSDFIDGLVQGIVDGWDTVIDTVSNLADAVVGTIKKKLGIASPSKVMAQMGMFSAVGFAQGMNDNAGAVESSAGSLAGNAVIGAGGGSSSTSSRGGISIGDIHVHVPEGTKDPEAFGRAVGAEIRSELLQTLEGLGLETGEGKAA